MMNWTDSRRLVPRLNLSLNEKISLEICNFSMSSGSLGFIVSWFNGLGCAIVQQYQDHDLIGDGVGSSVVFCWRSSQGIASVPARVSPPTTST